MADARSHVWRWGLTALWTCLLVVSWYCPAGVLCDLTVSSVSPSTTASSTPGTVSSLAPSPTSPPPTTSTTSSSSSSTSSPSPTPTPPIKPFLNYNLTGKFHLVIEEMIIHIWPPEKGCYNLTVDDYPALQSQPSHQSASVSSSRLNFTKQYWYNKTGQSNSMFVFTFILDLEPSSTDQMWYISSFAHRNRTDSNMSDICSFTYSGMNAVHAPSDLTYYCSDIEFQGDCVDGKTKAKVKFVGLFIQAFQIPSTSTYVDCGARDHNNSVIDVVVGSVVGATIGIALIVIVATLIIKAISKKVRWRGYNLLDD